jgi:DNA processing protein
LIKQGAKLVESAQDILEELKYAPLTSTTKASIEQIEIDAPYAQVLQTMGYDPVDADTLAARCQLDIAAINTHLLTLELDGLAEMLPGGLYRRIA